MIHNRDTGASMPGRSNDSKNVKEEDEIEAGNSSTESGGEDFSRTESGDSRRSPNDGNRSDDAEEKCPMFAPRARSSLRAGETGEAPSIPAGGACSEPELVVPGEGSTQEVLPTNNKKASIGSDSLSLFGPERFRFIAWDPGRFEYVRHLQMAERNQGFVALYRDLWMTSGRTGQHESDHGSDGDLKQAGPYAGGGPSLEEDDSADLVAVKVMPLTWMRENDADFERHQPHSHERPWRDVHYTALLSVGMQRPDIACPFRGLYCSQEDAFDAKSVYFAMGYANQGDLFDCLSRMKQDGNPAGKQARGVEMGPKNEVFVRGIMAQLCKHVQVFHEQARFAHMDLSLENVVLHQAKPNGPLQVRVIDFGMARDLPNPDWAEEAGRSSLKMGIPGKGSYRAPELHDLSKAGDLEVCDSFGLGVILFALLTGETPWLSTRPGEDRCFDCFSKQGLRAFLRRLRAPRKTDERVIDSLSNDAVELLDGLLNIDPRMRTRLRDPKDLQDPSLSVWSYSWWADERPTLPDSMEPLYGG